jgi:hypothetical protein
MTLNDCAFLELLVQEQILLDTHSYQAQSLMDE